MGDYWRDPQLPPDGGGQVFFGEVKSRQTRVDAKASFLERFSGEGGVRGGGRPAEGEAGAAA